MSVRSIKPEKDIQNYEMNAEVSDRNYQCFGNGKSNALQECICRYHGRSRFRKVKKL